MRRKVSSAPFFLLASFLFCWASLPKNAVDGMRSFSAAALAPTWKWAGGVKRYLSDRPEPFRRVAKESDSKEILRLQMENRSLRAQLEKVSSWLSSDLRIQAELEMLKQITGRAEKGSEAEFFQRRAAHMRDLLRWELMAMPAEAIYRDPASWSSSVWVNVGEEDNRVLGRTVIAKNSPVVSGVCLVGVVDYVGRRQSRIRLITDSGLSPSVRATRGELYLAKGELHGSSAPYWRSRHPILKGVGFNFDYPDEEGQRKKDVPILKEGDLLVTTGLDGVFPPDLHVGSVTKVFPYKGGSYAYEIEASPSVEHLNDLDTLFILPPRSD